MCVCVCVYPLNNSIHRCGKKNTGRQETGMTFVFVAFVHFISWSSAVSGQNSLNWVTQTGRQTDCSGVHYSGIYTVRVCMHIKYILYTIAFV